MKSLVAIVLGLAIGFAAAFYIVTNQKNAELEKLRLSQQSIIPESAPAPEPKVIERIVTVNAPAAPEESPQDILDDLIHMKPGEMGARNTALRQVVFKLEKLKMCGVRAVPAIRSFLNRNVDVGYETQSLNTTTNRGGAGFGAFPGGPGGASNPFGARRARDLSNLRADWVVPPTLRLGLISTLKAIGGEESEQALSEMLSTTGRGVEVAYLAITLDDMSPGKHRDAAVSAAKELLITPLSSENPDSLDQLSKSYLYGVLEYFKDSTFAFQAQQMLVGKNGQMDQDALDYLSATLKEQSVAALTSAYKSPALSNQFDRMMLGREILNYAGQSAQADAVFKETLNNPDLDSRMKAFAVLQLAGGMGPFASDSPVDPKAVQGRIALLNSMQTDFADDQILSQVAAITADALRNGQPVQPQDMMRAFGGGGFGGPGGGFAPGGRNNFQPR